jgi:hypothetical protein
MNTTSAQDAFHSSPAIICKWSWSSVNQTCTLSVPLQPNIQYNITIATGAKDIVGNQMVGDYIFSFKTKVVLIPPTIIKTNPAGGSKDVPIDTKITITYSKGMNRIVTESAIKPSPSFVWTTKWVSGDSEAILTPSAMLQGSTTYTITISTDARSIEGVALSSLYTFSFTTKDNTPPTVVSTIPVNGSADVDVNSQILITFSEAMANNTTEDAISVSSGSINKMGWANNNKTIILTIDLEPGTTYTVKISTGAKDLAGNTMLKEYVFSFTTKDEGISSTAISLSLLILLVVILIFLVLFLVRRRRKRSITKEIASEKELSVPIRLERKNEAKGVGRASSSNKLHYRTTQK